MIGSIATGLLAWAPATAGQEPGAEPTGLLLATQTPGDVIAAPVVSTEVYIWVTGMIVRAQVTQEFLNPTDGVREGVYVFPLPETAAVDHLFLRVGSRLIEGQIRERFAARRTYEAARDGGHRASLVEQQRPNVFTTRVANIGPGERVEVVIEYEDTLHYDGSEFRLRFPSLVAPRYVPQEPALPEDGAIWECAEDAEAGLAAPGRFSLAVELDPGFALRWLYSPSHAVVDVPLQGTAHLVRLDEGETEVWRDFVLAWAPAVGHAPQAALFTEEREDGIYALLLVLPPDQDDPDRPVPPREVIFVLDTSGSMAGPSLQQAKLAVQLALDRLRPIDRFNVIEFNSVTRLLFAQPVAAERERLEEAQAWVESLDADGGTEMKPAVQAALADPPPPGTFRQVIFVTDGAVANETDLFSFIERHLGGARLFTVGIGGAPNTYFMRTAARFGRGTFTYVGSVAEVSQGMEALLRKIERPALTDVQVDWEDTEAEVRPARLPDLYAGEPVVVSAKLKRFDGNVVIRGESAGQPWEEELSDPGSEGVGVAVLWARRAVEGLMDSVVEGADRENVRKAVIQLGLQHHLVTPHTSLVAVDVTDPDAAADTRTAQVAIGALPRTATAAPLCALLALLFACAALLVGGERRRSWRRPYAAG
jgi:Ca-activated chloride channel homolog